MSECPSEVIKRQVVCVADMAWCVLVGVIFGRLDPSRLLLRQASIPRAVRRALPLMIATSKGFIPVAIASRLSPGPTLPVIVAIFTLGSHLSTAGRAFVLWLLLGASWGLGLWSLGLVFLTLALAGLRYRHESLLPLAGPLVAVATFITLAWYGEDIHIVWSVAALLTTVAYLIRSFIRRSHPWLVKLKAGAVIGAGLMLVLAVGYVQSGRAGFIDMVACEQIVSGPPEFRAVALTFDDGPDPVYTPQVLSILRQANVKATFFMVGSKVGAYPEIARQVVAEGHSIGNHSYTHRDLGRLGRLQLALEIDHTQKVIREVCGVVPEMFRPPRGVVNPNLVELLAERNLVLALWSLSSRDWMQLPPAGIVNAIARRTGPGEILLFHDSGDHVRPTGASRMSTVLALPGVIERLAQRGFEFVTMDEVLFAARETDWTGVRWAARGSAHARPTEGIEDVTASSNFQYGVKGR